VPDFSKLPTDTPSLPPWLLNEWKPKITCKLPLPQDLMASPFVQLLAWLGKQLSSRQPFAFQGHEWDGAASWRGLGAEMW